MRSRASLCTRVLTLTALALAPLAAAAQQATEIVAADVKCPAPLGNGVSTSRVFCDVLSGRDPATGVVIALPPHRGPATVTFDLHNRHTYSEEQIRANRAFTRYTALVNVVTLENALVARAAIMSEFRRATDVVDRIGGGAGPDGVKAVVPTGIEHIVVTVPENVNAISLLGETLTIERADGNATYTAAGRPVAIISNVHVEFRPAPAPRSAAPPSAAPRPTTPRPSTPGTTGGRGRGN